LVGESHGTTATETIDITAPKNGYYVLEVDSLKAPAAGTPYSVTSYFVPNTKSVGNLDIGWKTLSTSTGQPSARQLRWGGLAPHATYLGGIRYADRANPRQPLTPTVVSITTGDALAPVSYSLPEFNTRPTVGAKVDVYVDVWDAPASTLSFGYQWYLDGEPIAGERSSTHKIDGSEYGKALSVGVSAALKGGPSASPVVSTPVPVLAASTTTSKLAKSTIKRTSKGVVTFTVKTNPAGGAAGSLKVYYGNRSTMVALPASKNGVAKVSLPKLRKGTYSIWARFSGADTVGQSVSAPKKLMVK